MVRTLCWRVGCERDSPPRTQRRMLGDRQTEQTYLLMSAILEIVLLDSHGGSRALPDPEVALQECALSGLGAQFDRLLWKLHRVLLGPGGLPSAESSRAG